MARRIAINFKEVKPKIVGALGVYPAGRIQRLEMPVNLPTTDVDELGNRDHAGTVTDVPEISITFQAMDVSIQLFQALVGEVVDGTGVDVEKLGYVDVIGEIKDDNTEDIAKTVVCRYAKITGFTYTYSVDGEATEEYTCEGTDKRWFKYNVIVDTFDGKVGAPFTYTLSQTPITLKNGDELVSVIAASEYLTEVAAGPAAGEYSVAATTLTLGETIAATNKVIAVYHNNLAGLNWTDITDDTIPAAVRGKNIPVLIGSDTRDRIQSVTLRGTFPTVAVKEMGSEEIVGHITSPVSVEGDLSVLDTDTELVALFATGDPSPADTEFRVCEFTESGIPLEIKILDPDTSCNTDAASATVLKTLYIPAITITSEGHSTNVGGNATQTFGFRSTTGALVVYSGAK